MKEILALHQATLAAYIIVSEMPETDLFDELREILETMLCIEKKLALMQDIDISDVNHLTIFSMDAIINSIQRNINAGET